MGHCRWLAVRRCGWVEMSHCGSWPGRVYSASWIPFSISASDIIGPPWPSAILFLSWSQMNVNWNCGLKMNISFTKLWVSSVVLNAKKWRRHWTSLHSVNSQFLTEVYLLMLTHSIFYIAGLTSCKCADIYLSYSTLDHLWKVTDFISFIAFVLDSWFQALCTQFIDLGYLLCSFSLDSLFGICDSVSPHISFPFFLFKVARVDFVCFSPMHQSSSTMFLLRYLLCLFSSQNQLI